jgi:hypothetical protein
LLATNKELYWHRFKSSNKPIKKVQSIQAKMKYSYEPLEDIFIYPYASSFLEYTADSERISYIMYGNGLDFDFDEWNDIEHFKLNDIFETDYNLLTESKKYFFGCSFDVYNDTYSDRLTTFLLDFPDANEVDFCDYELKKNLFYVSSEFLKEKIRFSLKKRSSFLNDKKERLTTQPQQVVTALENSLNWQGTNLEFTELVKALFESKKLNPELKQIEIFKRLKQFFNIDEFNENDKLKDVRKRTSTTTPFINILETSLNNWIKKKD